MNENDDAAVDRADGFRQAVADMPVAGGTMARERQLAALGLVLLVAGPVIAGIAYVLSSGTTNALEQRDAIVVGLLGVTVSLLGLGLYLRFSLGAILRLWLARAVADRER
jgi:hypothetical protein